MFSESDADDIGECSVCNKPGLLFECSTATHCKRWFHLECTPLLSIPEGDWTCAACTSNKPRHTIPPTLMDDLRDRQLDGEEIFTSSDGSYKECSNSSTYGFAIIMTHDEHLSYATGGKIEVQSTEASSLRVELEGLITAYELLPPDLYITHYMDNTQAIAIHDRLRTYGLPPAHKLMRMHYRRTIALLWSRMQQRGTYLSIIHVHSHLEKDTPRDHPLYFPRCQLAAADAAADAYHCQNRPHHGHRAFPNIPQRPLRRKTPWVDTPCEHSLPP